VDLKQLSAVTALNSMFKKGHFDICCIRNVGELLGVDPKFAGEAYKILQPLHCINFSDMPSELRDAIPSLIRECLQQEPTFQFLEDEFSKTKKEPAEVSFLGRLKTLSLG
jgi:hypothetical protein